MKAGEPLVIVTVYLPGDQLRPDLISRALSLQPSTSQTKGEIFSESKMALAQIGLWALTAQTQSFSIADHVDELLGKIGVPATPLNELEGVEEAYPDIFVTLDHECTERIASEGMLTNESLRRLQDLGLGMQFTVS